jgi:hypothetical protein
MSDEKTLSQIIREGMAEAMAAGNKAIWEQFQKDTAGGMVDLSREDLEADAEDHIIRSEN